MIIAVQLPTIAVHKKNISCCSQKNKLFSVVNVVVSKSKTSCHQVVVSFWRCKVTTFGKGIVRFGPFTSSKCVIWPNKSVCSYKSMPYCSATYLTATGGSSLSRGLTPSTASSSLWRESHLCRVFIDTPAAWASSLLVMDFMIRYLMFIYWEL